MVSTHIAYPLQVSRQLHSKTKEDNGYVVGGQIQYNGTTYIHYCAMTINYLSFG